MEGTKVNRITVNVDKKYDEVKISLYKTNELLGTLDEYDLDLPSFSTSGVSLKAYQAYCKDFVIELLNNDGIPGYYYEPKAEGQSIKYDPTTFKKGTVEYIDGLIGDRYAYTIPCTDRIISAERYKDGYIKDAIGEVDVRMDSFDITFIVVSEIKSGQLCRPKIIKFREQEYSFNITNINRIIKMANN
jgi:hypothetical protein